MKFRKMVPFFLPQFWNWLLETVPFASHDDIFFIISKPPFYCGLALKMQFARKLPGFLLLDVSLLKMKVFSLPEHRKHRLLIYSAMKWGTLRRWEKENVKN